MLMLALPMTLSHVTTPLLGLVDATVVGRLGEAHLLGAVALGAVIFDFLFWSFGSLRMATAGLTAQATGAGNRRDVDRTLARALVIAGMTGALLVLLQWPIAAIAFPIAGASPAVTERIVDLFLHPNLGRAIHAGELRHPRLDAGAGTNGSRIDASGRHQCDQHPADGDAGAGAWIWASRARRSEQRSPK